MSERREFLQMGAMLALAATATARSAEPAVAPKARGEIARFALGGDLAGKEAVLVDLIAGPAGSGAGNAHRHPGFVLGYVLEGAYAFGVNGETPRVIRAGEAFFEERGALHSGSASADPGRPAHLLAFMVVPAGQKLVLPA
jgi:quercetin dioxygenase-like cupin family protein